MGLTVTRSDIDARLGPVIVETVSWGSRRARGGDALTCWHASLPPGPPCRVRRAPRAARVADGLHLVDGTRPGITCLYIGEAGNSRTDLRRREAAQHHRG